MHLLIQDYRHHLYLHQYQIYISTHLQMQKEVCFDGQGQSEPIKNYKVNKNSENTQVPKASKNQVTISHHINKPDALVLMNLYKKVCKKLVLLQLS